MSSEDVAPDIDYHSHCVNEAKSTKEVQITKENEFNKIFIVEQHFDINNVINTSDNAMVDDCKEKKDSIDNQLSEFQVPSDKKACPRCTFHNELTANVCEICEYELPDWQHTHTSENDDNDVPVATFHRMDNKNNNSFIMDVKPAKLAKLQSQDIIDPREMLAVGDKVEVYSESGNKWCQGKIHKIYRDSSGEWITVKYAKTEYRIASKILEDTANISDQFKYKTLNQLLCVQVM